MSYVTYSDLYQLLSTLFLFGSLIVAIITLCKKK